ncbi:hypothetical protein [Staphylococcus hominis]|uniref:hypothetical protein n=2 Tax=Staphylococcus hominis TaxID=1290 RepID=UPI00115D1E14|nr:hypothetical protein [Staphylococcus hominis]MCI2872899.1 hypothetical protein [Staphylococcus hominis]MDS3895749.1 hypothetical protein [Staphylococcus hominis]
MSKYRKTNKNISKLRSDNRRLKMDIEGMNANHLAVYKESQKTKKKNTSNNKIDANKWLDKQKENGSIPIKQSFVLKSKSDRYFQDILTVFSEHTLSEKVMETTDDILKAKKYRTHKEASEEAIKYDFKVIALNTYVKEL